MVNKRLLEAWGDVGNVLSPFVINMAEKTIYVNTYQNADAIILVNVQIFYFIKEMINDMVKAR